MEGKGPRLVGDLDPEDGNMCPTDLPNSEALFDVEAFKRDYPGCFVFNERFPGGFTPKFKGEVEDKAGTLGVRGAFGSDGSWDVSYTMGQSRIDYSIRDTINASLGPATPTQFNLGSFTQTEQTLNLDLKQPIEMAGLASPLFAATGLEWREEEFSIGAGERASWVAGPLATQGFGIAANGYPGFRDSQVGTWTQRNIAGYVDLETDLRSDFTLATMGRVEKYDEFDTTTDFKLGALFRASSAFSLRGSASTGFRAPTVGQRNVSKVTTAFDDDKLVQKATLSPSCPESLLSGSKPLVPEESVTFTAGFVAEIGAVSLTADAYNIDVEDRLGVSETSR